MAGEPTQPVVEELVPAPPATETDTPQSPASEEFKPAPYVSSIIEIEIVEGD